MRWASTRIVATGVTVLLSLWTSTARVARADLKSDVDAALQDASLKNASVSVEVIRLGQARDLDRVVYQRDAAKPLIPASNLKVLTTALALETLGDEFTFRTVLLRKGDDLALVGDGDPAFGDTQFVQWLKKQTVASTNAFTAWAEALRKQGQTKFASLVVDDSAFDQELVNPNWPVDQLNREYAAEVSGLNFNANCLDLYLVIRGGTVEVRADPATSHTPIVNDCVVGSEHAVSFLRRGDQRTITIRGQINGSNTSKPLRATIHEPTLFAGAALQSAFKQAGVTIGGDPKVDRTIRQAYIDRGAQSGWSPLAVNETTLRDVLTYTNKTSNNLYAESLLRRVAASTGKPGSRALGAEAVKAFVTRAGAPVDGMVIDDGSGLSKENRVSAEAFSCVLAYMFHSAHRELYLSTLAVGGIDGTLEDRFTGNLKGRVFGKSGYVLGVRTLSGYLKTEAGEWFAFSILINDPRGGVMPKAKRIHEAIVEAIDRNAEEGR
jgi:D-alanyl-D-alanine carboxypeptidase/D-alanyl-D-alanine-endopeptidase (penicillin-binding protein 4)